MIIENDNVLSFALGSTVADFWFEKDDRLIADLALSGGKRLPVSLTDHLGQIHVEAHFPQEVKGKAAFLLYEDFSEDESRFAFWVDPSDGETKLVRYLDECSVERLDAVLAEISQAAEAAWADLDGYESFALAQTLEDREAFSMERILAQESGGDDPMAALLQAMIS